MTSARDDGPRSAILAYHEATKHSPESVRRRFHALDWDNKPHPLKVYTDLARVRLPDEFASLEIGRASCRERVCQYV